MSYLPLLALPLLVLVVLSRVLVVVTVRGASMQPAYHDGDRVLVRRTATVRQGRVVVFDAPDLSAHRWIIKRAVAVAGDPVPLPLRTGGVVPPGKLVLLGDNPCTSLDSRQAGFFPQERVLGVVVRRLITGGGPQLTPAGTDLAEAPLTTGRRRLKVRRNFPVRVRKFRESG